MNEFVIEIEEKITLKHILVITTEKDDAELNFILEQIEEEAANALCGYSLDDIRGCLQKNDCCVLEETIGDKIQDDLELTIA